MNSERTLNELTAESSGAEQIQATQGPAQIPRGLFSLFVCALAALAAALLFAFTLFWSPVATVQSAAHSPLLFDGEMAVIYQLEQAQTEACAQTTASGCFDASRQTDIKWAQILNALTLKLNTTLVVVQFKRSVIRQYNSWYKMKYSGLFK